MRPWLISLFILAALARTHGLGPFTWPELTVPGPAWYLLAVAENDTFGASLTDDSDDLRSFGFRLEAGCPNGWITGLQLDALTDRGDSLPGGRLDELTAVLSFPVTPQRDEHRGIRWGPGVRFYGSWGGAWLQNALHTGTAIYRPYSFRYEKDTEAEAFLHASGSWFMESEKHPDDAAFPLPGRLELGARFWAAVSTLSRVQSFTAVELAFAGGGMRTGLRLGYYDAAGLTAFSTVARVDVYERGAWLSWFSDVAGLRSGFRFHLGHRVSSGWFGLSVPLVKDVEMPRASDTRRRVTGEFGMTIGHYLFIQQLRWPLAAGPCLVDASVEYRTGVGPKTYEPDFQVRVDQFCVGPDLSLSLVRHPRIAVAPFVSLKAGVRHEGLFERPAERRVRLSQIAFPVLQAGAGLRLFYGSWGLSLSAESYLGRRGNKGPWYYPGPWAFGVHPSLRLTASAP